MEVTFSKYIFVFRYTSGADSENSKREGRREFGKRAALLHTHNSIMNILGVIAQHHKKNCWFTNIFKNPRKKEGHSPLGPPQPPSAPSAPLGPPLPPSAPLLMRLCTFISLKISFKHLSCSRILADLIVSLKTSELCGIFSFILMVFCSSNSRYK